MQPRSCVVVHFYLTGDVIWQITGNRGPTKDMQWGSIFIIYLICIFMQFSMDCAYLETENGPRGCPCLCGNMRMCVQDWRQKQTRNCTQTECVNHGWYIHMSVQVNNRLPTQDKFNLSIAQNYPPSRLFSQKKMGTAIVTNRIFRPQLV